MIQLVKIALGKTIRIAEVLAPFSLRRRLFELGFCVGQCVTVIKLSPFGRTMLVSVRGVVVALKHEVAKNILCEEGVNADYCPGR